MIKIVNNNENYDLIEMQKRKNLPSIKKDILPNQCYKPWRSINIDHAGRIFMCDCDGWLPYPVGYVFDFESLNDIFNSETAKKIQNSISVGTYEFCDTNECPVKTDIMYCKTMENKYVISIGIDDSCNLSCPSCRDEIRYTKDIVKNKNKLLWIDRIKSWIEKVPSYFNVHIYIGSNGEPFASPLYLNLLENEFNNQNVIYSIRTNGLLSKRKIKGLNLLPKLNSIDISIDAASKKVYEYVRQPGKWNTLVKNVDYLIELRKNYNFRIVGNFVIQKANIDDILPFIDWCDERDIVPCFTLLQHWTHFKNFDAECVHRPQDDLHKKFLEIIKSKKFKSVGSNARWSSHY